MNISHKHKTIWWAPERAGTKITRKILSNYDFLVFDPKIGDEVSIETRYTSHLNEIPEKYADYKLNQYYFLIIVPILCPIAIRFFPRIAKTLNTKR